MAMSFYEAQRMSEVEEKLNVLWSLHSKELKELQK